MAGSGKTTFVHRLSLHIMSPFYSKSLQPPLLVNLDPAVLQTLYSPDIDIRDVVPYKETMEKFKLGPNGAILTCLNLYASQFDKTLSEIETLSSMSSISIHDTKSTRIVLLDTPGQIELFTWSAAGSIITECLSSSKDCSTIILYILDTPSCANPTSFMSNMLYACSIMYKTQLPMIIVMNKIDIASHEPIQKWLTDWESFQLALHDESSSNEGTMMTGFVHSISLVLEEFYKTIQVTGVSSTTGEGFDDILKLLNKSAV